MDSVFIQNLSLIGRHGCLPEEWAKPQEFVLDIAVELDTSAACRSDSLNDTVCWTNIQKVAQEVVEGPSLHLIETIADSIAKRLLSGDKRIMKVEITVKKSEVLVKGIPGVHITRSRE